ncbi:flagellar protein [Brevibacillus ruminantium]|uniref:Flagellar protein n=1 Tax=Brevibacillus ruminantium TaxID=2950604 RepID=A0ABY4WGS6_9BACL|nr:TIGR03826 family flagellar region protein [Brevibacillus ruminantium]USG65333.1 flagellar protein [Brevibacillus ruminantium]
MSLGKLSNCTRCDALFVQTVRDICPKCHQAVEKEYEECARYLRKRENRGANIYQVSEATGVSVKQITKFIKEGRISVEGSPSLGYPCESCGTLIRSGNLCESCVRSLQHDITQQSDLDRRLEEERRERQAQAAYKRRTKTGE